MTTPRKGLKALVAAAVLIGLSATAASASAFSISDPVGDVRTEAGSPNQAQKNQTDIVRVVYGVNSYNRVYARFKYRDLISTIRQPMPTLRATDRAGHRTYAISLNWNTPSMYWRSGSPDAPTTDVCAGRGKSWVNTTSNEVIVTFPVGCFPKGYVMYRPYGASAYINNSMTVTAADRTVAGASFTPNP